MIVLKRSGHWYRFFTRFSINPPYNLCTLFWKCLWFPLLFTFIGMLISLLAVYVLLGHVHLFLLFYGVLFPDGYEVWGVLVALGWIIFVAYWVIEGIKYTYGVTHVPVEWKDSNLVKIPKAAYVGFKEKFCPLVTWKDE